VKTTLKGLVCATSAVILSCSAAFLSGCAGLVSSANSTGQSAVDAGHHERTNRIGHNRQLSVIWTTNVLPTPRSITEPPLPTELVRRWIQGWFTSHQVTLSGLAAGTTYYYKLIRPTPRVTTGTGGNKFNTGGFSLSGTINSTAAGNGAAVALSGAASTSATADNAGNYTFAGLPNGLTWLRRSTPAMLSRPAIKARP